MTLHHDDYAQVAEQIRAELWRDSWGRRLGDHLRQDRPTLWAALDRLTQLVDERPTPDSSTERLF